MLGILVTYLEGRQAGGGNRLFSIFAKRVVRPLRVKVSGGNSLWRPWADRQCAFP